MTTFDFTGGNIRFFVKNYASYKVEYAVDLNQWTHVAGTYDGSQLKLYVDGVLRAAKGRTVVPA